MKYGATMKKASITTNATRRWATPLILVGGGPAAPSETSPTAIAPAKPALGVPRSSLGVIFRSLAPTEETRRSHEQHERHDDEDDRVRRLGVEHLREPFDHAERVAGDDRSHDRSEPADDDDREDDDDEVGAHQRVDLIHRRREHAREPGQAHA